LWLLTRSANVRIFQQMTTLEIIRSVVEPYGAYGGLITNSTSTALLKRNYCVQYRESDFNFVSRLLEDEGIYYFFKHSAGKHEMVLADAPNVHANQLGLASLSYNANPRRRSQGAVVSRWSWSRKIETGKVVVRDHHFMLPPKNLEHSHTAQVSHPHGQIEAYDYSIGLPPYADAPDALQGLFPQADGIAKHRLEAQQAARAAAEGSTSALRLCTGARFKLAEHPVTAQNGEYVVHSTSIRLRVGGYESGAGAEAASKHECEFTAYPAAVPFRAPRLTPKPRVSGPQTAVVVGPAGEEIYVDKYGRVKVQFFWDRKDKKDDTSSCWIRVAQASAGKQWGAAIWPRIGHEVIVDFLEGDPDQPLIVGGVYNADNMPPYELPANMTQSGRKSRSTKGGGASDYNELRFEDKKGSELVLVHAQKDRLDEVEHDLSTWVGHDEVRKVDHDSALIVGESQQVSVGKNHAMTIGEAMDLDVGKNLSVSAGENFGATVGKDFTVDAGTAYSMKAGTDVHLKSGTNFGAEAGTNAHLKGGINVVIEAGVQLTLKAGSNSIVIGPDGISITGMPLVKINSGGGAGSGSGAKPVKPTKPTKATKPEILKDPLAGNG
jgi:type VI secretion system secreted protein VgrG